MSDELLEKYAKRLGIYDSETLEIAKEKLRLIDGKGMNVTNSSIKVVLAINFAANSSNTDFDRAEALKLSGLREKEYNRQKDTFEKLLDLTKKLSLDDICAKLDINDVLENDADRLLKAYKKRNPLLNETENASFLAMALYQSHKLRKIKNTAVKQKLTELSKIRAKVWKSVEEEWDKWIQDCSPLAESKKQKTSEPDQFEDAIETETSKSNEGNAQRIIFEEVPYEDWRDDVIKKARSILSPKNS